MKLESKQNGKKFISSYFGYFIHEIAMNLSTYFYE